MVTDRYQHIQHHPTPDDLAATSASWAEEESALLGIDNLPRLAADRERRAAPSGGHPVRPGGTGAESGRPRHLRRDLSIAQFGSTRSINAGAAAAIAMHAWVRTHADLAGADVWRG